MGVGTPISQYEKATSIPDETLYIAEMGDGSGTKVVTQETLTKEVGKGLKIGNLEELQTEAKGSIVAAINEAAQSGGGGSAVDILDTKEEIEANTETGKAAGAQAVKAMFGELNDNLENIMRFKIYDVQLSGEATYVNYKDGDNSDNLIPVQLIMQSTSGGYFAPPDTTSCYINMYKDNFGIFVTKPYEQKKAKCLFATNNY